MLKGRKDYTIADIEALPEGERAELIDGELFRMDTPMRVHQDILTQLVIEISLYIRKNKGKWWIMKDERQTRSPCAILFPSRSKPGSLRICG